jgi:hypothetical protein
MRAMLLQAFYSIRSERLLMERLEYDLLFRWFVGIGVDDAAWDHSVSLSVFPMPHIHQLQRQMHTSEQQSERPELTADRSTARQQQIRFVPAPFMLRCVLLPAFSF